MATSIVPPTGPTAQIQGLTEPPQAPQNTIVQASRKPEEENPAEDDRELLAEAHRRFRKVNEYESVWRGKATTELNFIAGDHWTTEMREERRGLPCLTFDKISPAILQVLNSNRQAPPEPRVSPVGDGADVDTAKILQGLLRNIAIDSDAEIARETALAHACWIGRGWVGVCFEYENEIDFKQKLRVVRVSNPFSIYPDPASDAFDYSDMSYMFKTEDLDIDTFKKEYPNAQAGSAEFSGNQDKIRDDWYPEGAVRVAEYWWVEKQESAICQLRDGTVVPWDAPEAADVKNIVNVRKVITRKIRMAKITGSEVLERTDDYPGKWIPYVAVMGDEIIQDNKRSFHGMIRPAMDANLSYDYMRSKEAQAIGLAPISTWLVEEESIQGHETDYADANRKPLNVLKYRVRDEMGNELPAPQRLMPSTDISAIVQAIAHADNDVKSMTQEFDASLGKPVDQSGRAVIALQRQGDNAHFNYVDNLARALRQEARIELDLIPHVYSEERAITVFDPDGKVRQVQVNAQRLIEGANRIYNLKEVATRYDVVMGTGPAFNTRMQEAATVLPQVIQVAPIIMQAAPDLVLKILNLPYGEEIVERVRQFMGVPGDDSDMPPALAAQMMKSQQLIQLLTQELAKAKDENMRADRDNASKERIAILNNEGKIAAVEAKGGLDALMALFEAHLAARNQQLEANPQTALPTPPPVVPPPQGGPGAPPAATLP